MRFSDQQNLRVVFAKEVLALFEQHRQLTSKDLEAGGQLFARLSNGEVVISKATGLRDGDKRGRYLFWPNRLQERNEIKNLHKEGFHFVGDWHTHPEPEPKPSNTDLINILDCYSKSKHGLRYFIMVIVGSAHFPDGLHVSVHNTNRYLCLRYIN